MSRYRRYALVGCVFLLLFSLVMIGAYAEYQRETASEKEKLRDDLRQVKSNIEHMIASRVINAKGFTGAIQISDEFTDKEFDLFAEGIYESADHVVKDVVMITDTRISHVYPSYYGEGAIGIDLADVEDQRDVLLHTKETGDTAFIGPVKLVEGGLGIIVRVPIKVHGDYYGQVAIVYDYYNFIEASGLKEIVDETYVSLMGSSLFTNEQTYIWYNSRDLGPECAVEEIELDNIIWTLRACPAYGWNGYSQLFFMILTFGLIICSATAYVYNRQLVLKGKLMTTNEDLKKSVDALEVNKKDLEIHIGRIRDKESYIRYLADHDSLTGLYNRRKFTEHINRQVGLGEEGIIVLLDLDNFKNINDSHGHVYGDKLLESCGSLIEETIGSLGTAYRFGGDEFLIIFNGDMADDAVRRNLNKISRLLAKQTLDDAVVHMTMSAGIVRYPEYGKSVEELLIRADVAMYHGKYSGKNKLVFFQRSLLNDFDVRVEIERTIRKAVEDDGFTMMYQPIVDSHTGEVVSFEALIRLRDNKYGPMEFIPVAEDTSLIHTLGIWIIEEVAKQIRQWLDLGLDAKPIAINLSPKQLQDSRFSEKFFEILYKYSLPMSLINIEITEGVLLENKEENISVLNGLYNAGIHISLDDFGTGYSSLNYLTFLPVDKVKLDKSLKDKFIRHNNPQVLAGIIDMSHGLSLRVVAEGVEDLLEWQMLKEAKCDLLQGYLFSKPVPAIKAATLISKKYGSEEMTS